MKKKKNEIKLFCEFVIPPILIWASIVVIPLIYGIYLTFTNWNGLSPNYDLVGFSNYAAIFTDKTFLSSLWKTFVYVFFVVVFSNVLGLALALLLTYGIKLQGLFRTCFFAANMIGGVVMGYIWNYIFSFALTKVGAVTGWGLLQKSWLTSPGTALVALIVVAVWQLSGYLMVIYVAGLTNVSKDMLEAAKIDGAGPLQRVKAVTFPAMKPVITFSLIMALGNILNNDFEQILLFYNSAVYEVGDVIDTWVYRVGLGQMQYGVGSAVSMLKAVISLVLILSANKISKKATGRGMF